MHKASREGGSSVSRLAWGVGQFLMALLMRLTTQLHPESALKSLLFARWRCLCETWVVWVLFSPSSRRQEVTWALTSAFSP